jgi:transglutaminase-like putative cysteine protease
VSGETLHLTCESAHLTDYLAELDVVDFSHPLIQEMAQHVSEPADVLGSIRKTYEFVRDEVRHSLDIHSARVTCAASEVMRYREGICYAKSHLLAALLRAQRIPAGFCYQRLLLGSSPAAGYCIHALNAVFVTTVQRWVRLDARGNKPGISATFSLENERLAFHVQPELGENDYPTIYARPHPKTIAALKTHADAIAMCAYGLPDEL